MNGEVSVSFWLLIAPFLAGVFPVKRGWLVPVVTVLALLATQPLGGVAWWSLRENEGPFILLTWPSGDSSVLRHRATGPRIRNLGSPKSRKCRSCQVTPFYNRYRKLQNL